MTHKTIRVPQDRETPLSSLETPFGMVLALYARSNDSVDAGTVGQDYATFRYDEGGLAFAVCDGVGQSFMGDLAARILGDALLDWLWALGEQPADADAFREQVTDALDEMVPQAKQQVAEYTLPETLPPIVKQALEMQRDYGSESMFVAGRLTLNGEQPWIALAWLGDAPVAAIDFDGELVDLGPRGSTAERWNANTGVKGTVHTWVSTVDRVARVAGYTDGLALERVPTDEDLARLGDIWKADPPADDATLIDVRLAPSPETTGGEDPEGIERLAELVVTEPEEPEDAPPDDQTRPIPTEAAQKSPVSGARPIDKLEEPSDPVKPEPPRPVAKQKPTAPASPAVGEWRPLTAGSEPAKPKEHEDARIEQIRAWQQAAREKLIGAKLALDQIERLLFEEDE